MSSPKLELLLTQLKACANETMRIAGEVPEANRLMQLRPGKATPMWLIGHLANTVNTVVIRWILEKPSLVDKEFGKKFAPDFAGGDAVTANAADYPSWEVVVAKYKDVMEAAITGLAEVKDDELPLPLKGKVPEPLRGFFSSNETALSIMVLHDSHHRGQIALMAKLNG